MNILTVIRLLPHTPPGTTVWRQLMGASNAGVRQFTVDKNGERQNMVPYINRLAPGGVVLYFATVVTLLVEDT